MATETLQRPDYQIILVHSTPINIDELVTHQLKLQTENQRLLVSDPY